MNKFYKCRICVNVIWATCLFFCTGAKAGNSIYLKPSTTFIVTSASPNDDELKSAQLLNKWLNHIYKTDSGFQIIKEHLLKETTGKILIVLGNAKLASSETLDEQQPYAFEINRKEWMITIRGASSMATLLATTYFLDRFCGIRFYLPGELFISEPTTHRVNISNIKKIREIPFTKYVFSTGYVNYALEGYKNVAENYWSQINGLQRKNWGSHQHSMGERFFNDSIIKLFPEIFPIVNGQRYFPKSKQDQQWEPDFTEPKLVDAAVYSAIQYFKANPSINYISFSVQDSYVYPAEGKMGEYMKAYPDTKEGKKRGYTNAYIEFLNKLAASLQTALPANGIIEPKTIVYIAYGYVSYMPLVKLHPSILPISVYPLSATNRTLLLGDTGVLKKWSGVTNRIGNHDWAEGRGFIYPRIYTNLVAKYLQAIKRNGTTFEYAHLESYPNWSLDGPKYYFMSKLYWNPELKTDSLLRLFCMDMFGKASGDMMGYFKDLENLNLSMDSDSKISRGINGYVTQLPLKEYELSLVESARKFINKAYSRAKTAIQKKRILLFSDGFKISEGFFELYNSKNIGDDKINAFKSYLQNTVAGNPMMLNMAVDKDFVTKMNTLIDQVLKSKR